MFLGHYDGTLTAHDAKTLQGALELQRRHRHQRAAVSYAVNGKQYIAVLVGSRNPQNVWANAPELKHSATASMLYVFEQ